MKRFVFTATVAVVSLLAVQGHAGEVADAIKAGTLADTDAVAYMVYGVEEGGRVPYSVLNGKVERVGAPYGFEVKYDDGPSQIISVRKNDGCNYTIEYLAYRYDRKAVLGVKPTKAVFDLDFSKVVRVSVVRVNEEVVKHENEPPFKSELVGLGCTSRENGERACESLAKSEMATGADGATLLKTFAYFREKFCPLRK